MAKGKEEPKPLCFVIGPIGKDGSLERKHADLLLHAVIKDVLEAQEFGYRVKRADEDADPGMIGDRVISDIINAELVVADLTDLNPNALYELGIRHSKEAPTIHVAKTGTDLPFDTISHRTIFVDLGDWQSIIAARTRLAESARAIKDPEYRVTNPITQANASFKMRESSDPKDQVIAELRDRLSSIENKLRDDFIETGKTRSFDERLNRHIQGLRRLGISAASAERYIIRYAAANGEEVNDFKVRQGPDGSEILDFSFTTGGNAGRMSFVWRYPDR